MNYDKVMERIMDDYNLLKETDEHDVLGVFLYGSQNYECDTELSDIDTKAIIIPTIDELILGLTKTRETIVVTNGTISVFDIHSMHDCIKKQNINFLEILFTPYYVINSQYAPLWEEMRHRAEEIARMNEYAAVQCIYGCIVNKIKKIFHAVPSNFASIEKYGYDNKALADVLRLKDFIERYINHVSYARCLVPNFSDKLINIKLQPQYTTEEVRSLVDVLESTVNELLDEYNSSYEENPNYDLLMFINEVTKNCCKAYIKDKGEKEKWPSLSC